MQLAVVAKINTGIYKGKIIKLSKTPPFFIPTVSATPIAPIKLSTGVPSNKVKNSAV